MKENKTGWSSEQQGFLTLFLESSVCPPNTMNFYQLDGYLRAICCGPGVAYPAEWLPLVFNDERPGYCTDAEEARVIGAIMELYNFHADQVLSACCDLPLPLVYSANRHDRCDLEQWARGFLQGYIFWQESWDALLASMHATGADYSIDLENLADELDAVLYIVSTVADAELALSQGTRADELTDIFHRLPEALITCGSIGRRLYERDLANTNSQKTGVLTKQFPRESAKVGRNDSCLCGSGKKFKKCCLH